LIVGTWESDLDSLVKAIGLAVPAAFLLSIVHESGLYKALALSFTDLPVTWNDLLRVALSWLPGTLVVFLLGMSLNLILDRVEG
jgi:hypothetical protein